MDCLILREVIFYRMLSPLTSADWLHSTFDSLSELPVFLLHYWHIFRLQSGSEGLLWPLILLSRCHMKGQTNCLYPANNGSCTKTTLTFNNLLGFTEFTESFYIHSYSLVQGNNTYSKIQESSNPRASLWLSFHHRFTVYFPRTDVIRYMVYCWPGKLTEPWCSESLLGLDHINIVGHP